MIANVIRTPVPRLALFLEQQHALQREIPTELGRAK